jgi:ATP-dependent phosphofructokinase / diphosphate-dependent phosphofructokinase
MGKNMLICQSGGPTAVINASLVGAYQRAIQAEEIEEIYGGYNGIIGVLREEFIDLKKQDMIIEELQFTPSSALGSCRYRLAGDFKHKDYQRIFQVFTAHNIGYFFYNGGNDSMDTAMKLDKYAKKIGYEIKIIGIPKTIDNDLEGTDNCPGYGSAARYINTCILESAFDCYTYSLDTIMLMEVMGRHSGWLAASSVLALHNNEHILDLIYLPEISFTIDKFLSQVKDRFKEKKIIFIVVSEGLRDEKGEYFLAEQALSSDQFGHSRLGGVSLFLQDVLEENICKRVKVVNPGILQRCATHCASGTDLNAAYWVGYKAVEFALKGNSGYMVGIRRISNKPYQWNIELVSLDKVASREKKFPLEWIVSEGNYVTREAIDYIEPLIVGNVNAPVWKGLPRYHTLKKEFIPHKLPLYKVEDNC